MRNETTGLLTRTAKHLHDRAVQARNKPPAFGPDLDTDGFVTPIAKNTVSSVHSLDPQIRQAALHVGVESDESKRAGSYFQIDHSVIYQRLQHAYEGQIELMTTTEALQRYEWLQEYWWQAVAIDADKFTAKVALEQTGGFFLHVLPGQRVTRPLQACLLVQENNISQNIHNLILMEEDSEIQVITGCTLHPDVKNGLHIGVTEAFLKRGSTLANTMIHNWAEGFHVRPRAGVIASDQATYISNYILLQPAASLQTFPRVVLAGDGSRAEFRNIVVGTKDSYIDIGSRVELAAKGTRAEALARAVAQDRSQIYLRGLLVGKHNQSQARLDCRGMLLSEQAQIHAIPELAAIRAPLSQLSHEASVGPIEEEAVEYVMTRGLTRDEATSTLIRGFLHLDLPGLPEVVVNHLNRVLAATAERSL